MTTIKFTLIASLIFSLFALPAQAKSVTSIEYQTVIDTAYNYFNGAANGDQEMMSKAFDYEFGDVKIMTTDKSTGKESIRVLSLEEFAGYFKNKTTDSWQAKVLSVDIVDEKMAMVKLDFQTSKTHYIDYLVMYKRNNNWRIINKTMVAKTK